MSKNIPDRILNKIPKNISFNISKYISENKSDKIPENFPNNISKNIPPPGLAPLGWVRFHGMGRTPGAALRVCSRRAPPIPSPTPVQE